MRALVLNPARLLLLPGEPGEPILAKDRDRFVFATSEKQGHKSFDADKEISPKLRKSDKRLGL